MKYLYIYRYKYLEIYIEITLLYLFQSSNKFITAEGISHIGFVNPVEL